MPHWALQGSSDPTQVRYFTAEESKSSVVSVDKGRLRFTEGLRTLPVGKELIFVIDRDGRMIVSTPEDGKIHHSSLAAGDLVRMAGTLQVDKNGRITAIANDSGHYRPTDNAFALWLRDNGAALPGADKMTVSMKGNDPNFASAKPLGLADVLVRGPGGRPLATMLPAEITSALRVGKPFEFAGKALDIEVRSAVGEIDRFETSDPAVKRRLFSDLETSIKGPKLDAEGWTLFPLGIKYVGEDEVGFSSWLRREPLGELRSDSPNVRYLSAEDQLDRRAVINDGKLVRADGTPLVGQGSRQKLIFVIDASGNLIADLPIDGQLHHSSLSGGKPVRMAGELQFNTSGSLESISNTSGHFRPDDVALVRAVMLLKQKGLNVDGVLVYPARPDVNIAEQYGTDATNNAALLNLLPVQKRSAIGKLRDAVGAFVTKARDSASVLPTAGELALGIKQAARNLRPDTSALPSAGELAGGIKLAVRNLKSAAGKVPLPSDLAAAVKQTAGNVVDPVQRLIRSRRASPEGALNLQTIPLADSKEFKATAQEFESNRTNAEQAAAKGDKGLLEKMGEIETFQRDNPAEYMNLANRFNDGIKGPLIGSDGIRTYPMNPGYATETHGELGLVILSKKPGEEGVRGLNVKYYTPEEQTAALAIIEADRVILPDQFKRGARLVFVIDQAGRMIVGEHDIGRIQHSSLAAGNRVIMAGEIHVLDNGQILELNNRSGHYHVQPDDFADWLARTNMSATAFASDAKIIVFGKEMKPVELLAREEMTALRLGEHAAPVPVDGSQKPLYQLESAPVAPEANPRKPTAPAANDNGGGAESAESNPDASKLSRRR